MHELMCLCDKNSVPLYRENPLKSKLWLHPLIKTWVGNERSKLVGLDYCQLGTIYKKSTQILVFHNPNFTEKDSRRCKGKGRQCPATGKQHKSVAGRITGKDADK